MSPALGPIKKVAIAVILISVVIGSVFGLLASSTTPKSQQILITAKLISLKTLATCPSIPENYSDWVQLQVYANQTNLVLESLTALTPRPYISLTITLNSNESSFVYYHRNNSTLETVSIPIVPYWTVGEVVDLSVTYYYGGNNPSGPTVFTVPPVAVRDGNLTC
jgi:hypothetical protein